MIMIHKLRISDCILYNIVIIYHFEKSRNGCRAFDVWGRFRDCVNHPS